MPRPAMRSLLATQTLDPLNWTGSAIAAGITRRERLERGRPLRVLRLRCTAIYNVTVLGAPVYHEDAPFNLLNRLRVRRAGGEPRVDISGISLEILKRYEQGTPSFASLPVVALGDNLIEFDVSIPFAPANSPFQRAWGLLLSNNGTDTLEVEMGAPAGIFATPPTTFTVTDVSVQIVQAEEASIFGPRMLSHFSPWKEPLVRHLIETEDPITADSSHIPIPRNNIGTGGDLESSLFITRQGTPQLRTDVATYGRFRLRYGRVTILEEEYDDVKRRQKATTSLETLMAGVLYYPHDVERLLDATVDLAAQPGTRYEFDSAAGIDPATNLTVVRSEVYPQRIATGAPRR